MKKLLKRFYLLFFKRKKKKPKLLFRLRPRKGQKVFQCNVSTLEVSEAKPVNRRIDIKENHKYCVAINSDNAEKKFIKMLNSIASAKGLTFKFYQQK